MKIASRLSAAVVLLGAMVFLTGCTDPEPGKGGTIPPAWEAPGATRIGDGRSGWNPDDEKPTSWSDGAVDERTGVRRMEVAGFPKVLYFGYDTDRINASELAKVAEAAAFMKSNPNLVLVIEGHCDERGTEEYNRALGERRARAVESKMAENGVDLAVIRTVSYGEDKPAVAGSGEGAWSKNRRAELWVGKMAH